MSDSYAIPASHPESAAPLVAGIREHVDAWRRTSYPGSSATSRRLLEHWFLDEHQTPDGEPFQYFFAQREAAETVIYLYEVARQRTLASMATQFASRPVAVEGQRYPRYVVKAATGSGKTKVMSLLIAWSYFHRLRETASELTMDSLVVAPNLIVFERLRADFEHGAIFRDDPIVPPEWRGDFDLAVCLRDEPIPAAAPGVLVVNDEAHHLHDAIRRDTNEPLTIWQTLYRLHELTDGGITAQLDFSATPRGQDGRLFDDVVVDYPLSQAIDDGIVKRPIIGELAGGLDSTSNDAAVRYRQRIGAGVAKWREFRDTLTPASRKPLLFVMAEDTRSADQIAAHLETLPDLAGRVLTIHVNMAGPNRGEVAKTDLEQARTAARKVDRDDNIEIPQLSRVLHRSAAELVSLRPEDVPPARSRSPRSCAARPLTTPVGTCARERSSTGPSMSSPPPISPNRLLPGSPTNSPARPGWLGSSRSSPLW